jgi:hypothetical protein
MRWRSSSTTDLDAGVLIIPATRWPDDMFFICSKVDERVNLELPAPRPRPPVNSGEVVANKTGISDRDSFSLKGRFEP